MRSFHRLVIINAAVIAAVASAYVNRPHFLAQRCLRRDSWSSNTLAVSYEPFQENWEAYQSPLLRAQSVAKFCSEIGCTIQAYQGTTNKLKRRKRDLSHQMLIVEDELDRLKNGKIKHDAIHRIFDSVGIQPSFSSNLWSLLPKSVHRHIKANVFSSDLHSDSHVGSILILRERRKKLSNRALAIQNLLATLEVMEYSGMGTTRELAEEYRNVSEEERIDIFAEPGSKVSSWASFLPQPPRLPPTVKQFMNQCRSDHSSAVMMISHQDDDVNEESTPEWFARKRVSAYPFSTATAASKGLATNKIGRTARGVFYPFSSNTNSTSSLR